MTRKPWPTWLEKVEGTAFILWKASVGVAFGLGVSSANGVACGFMIVVGALFVIDRLLTGFRLASQQDEKPRGSVMTWEGAINIDGDGAKKLREIIEQAQAKPTPEKVN